MLRQEFATGKSLFSIPEDIRHVEITLRTVTALKAIIEDIASSLSGQILCAVMQNYQKWAKSASFVKADIWNTFSNV